MTLFHRATVELKGDAFDHLREKVARTCNDAYDICMSLPEEHRESASQLFVLGRDHLQAQIHLAEQIIEYNKRQKENTDKRTRSYKNNFRNSKKPEK